LLGIRAVNKFKLSTQNSDAVSPAGFLDKGEIGNTQAVPSFYRQ